MTYRIFSVLLAAVVLCASSGFSYAEEPAANLPATIGGMPSTPKSQQAIAQRRKAAAKLKRVDVNNATAAQLKKLSGIGDAEAARIIAGRPYMSKVWLVTNGILPEGYYLNIKHLIFVGQPSAGRVAAGKKE